jgi:hypothetical protein
MGGGSWTKSDYTSYCTTVRGIDACSLSLDGAITKSMSSQEMFKARSVDSALKPYKVMRECIDTAEHPNTIPIILALDVTGSMGSAAVEVAKKLNVVMTNLYDKVTDVEFMVMGIGDLSYDRSPIQISQFESDIRIAEQMDKVFFEYGGGGNLYESYTVAWYMGARHTKLDCWSRGKKGIIITMGDERVNPYLPHEQLNAATGDNVQADIESQSLFSEASEKYDIYHLDVNHGHRWDDGIDASWNAILDTEHYKKVTLETIANTIVDIIVKAFESMNDVTVSTNNNGEIFW